MGIRFDAPTAPRIADLLGQRQVDPVTTAQDEARRTFAERMAAIGSTTSLPQALADVGGHIANVIMSRRDMARAKEADQTATAAEGERRERIAQMLAGAGYAPEQAVGYATASPDETSLIATLTGMRQDQENAAAARDLSERQHQATIDRFDADRALRREGMSSDRDMFGQKMALERQKLASSQAEQDDFSATVSRILAANPDLAKSEDGLRQAQNVALGLVKSATDPVRGGTATYNVATGQGAPIQTPTPSLEPFGASGQPISIEQMAGEVGAIPFAEDVIARTVGQAAPSVVNEARTKAASQLDFLKQKAVTAFATSARPPVIEQERIASLFPSKGIFDSEARAQQQLGHLRDLAVTTHDDYIGLINSGQLPFDQENELRGKVAELRQVVNMLPETSAPMAVPSVSAPIPGSDPLGLFD